jgi:hypothetical protein
MNHHPHPGCSDHCQFCHFANAAPLLVEAMFRSIIQAEMWGSYVARHSSDS